MTITKPTPGEHDWDLKLNAALDALDLKETISGSETKATQAYESAAEYTDARINELDIPSGTDITGALTAAQAAQASASSALSAASGAASSAATANASASAAADSAALASSASDATVADRVSTGTLTGAALGATLSSFATSESLAVLTTSPAGDITLEAFGA